MIWLRDLNGLLFNLSLVRQIWITGDEVRVDYSLLGGCDVIYKGGPEECQRALKYVTAQLSIGQTFIDLEMLARP